MFWSKFTIRFHPFWMKNFRFVSQQHHRQSSQPKTNDNVSICVVGNGSDGNPRSIFLDYNDRIFMFNCGEGVQRLISDLGFKPSKIDTFFATSNRWHNFTGLAALLLARYDSGSRHFNINNNNDFSQKLFENCTAFDMKLKRLKYNYFDTNHFIHENLSIQIVSINFGDQKSAVYLGNLNAQKGGINLEKCFQQKVPRNLVTELEQNRFIQNQDSRIIQPSDVCDPDRPEQNFLIFECIDQNFIEHLFLNEAITEFIPKCEIIVHFTKDDYLQTKSYRKFFQKYSSSNHFLITENNPSFSLRSNYRFQLQLNQLDSNLFPCLRTNVKSSSDSSSLPNNQNIIYSPTGIRYIFRSSTSDLSVINTENVPQFPTITDALQHKDGSERDGIEESIEKLREKQLSTTKPEQQSSGMNFPEFLFLGTASSHPLPIRNVSGILVNIDLENSILLDCGENTYGQLLNFYGQENIVKILAKIKLIFISHHHSDHHLGLINLLKKRKQSSLSLDNNNKLWILLPPMVHKFLQNSQIINLNHYTVVRNQFFQQFRSSIMKTLSIKEINLIPVDHCAYAFGIGITDKNGFKFVYSGDTQPCDRLVQSGQDCNLLIHEATVEDSLKKFARTNFHSTISEAINVGRMMQAKFIILTHFSQRYGKLPLLPEENADNNNIGLAFDNMIVSGNQLHRIPLLYDTLKCMYAKHMDRIRYRSDLYERKFNGS